jgi:Papain family cysteine protease
MSTIGPHLLGRTRVDHDPKSRAFAFPAKAAPTTSVWHRHWGPTLDQADVGSCTADALVQCLDTSPVHHKGDHLHTQTQALHLYTLETVVEGEAPYPPNDPGGSGLMVCKAAKQAGMISSYSHIFGIDHAIEAIASTPFIIGINWYDAMFTPDPKGVVTIGGHIAGGHEVLVTGYSPKEDMWRLLNSWGKPWPSPKLNGKFFMSTATLDRLLTEDGDATVPAR